MRVENKTKAVSRDSRTRIEARTVQVADQQAQPPGLAIQNRENSQIDSACRQCEDRSPHTPPGDGPKLRVRSCLVRIQLAQRQNEEAEEVDVDQHLVPDQWHDDFPLHANDAIAINREVADPKDELQNNYSNVRPFPPRQYQSLAPDKLTYR
jgi:hypothetical protein